MHSKKILFLTIITFLVTSCADTYDSVKRGLTGAKRKGGDEFFIQKKDPLTLPPNYETLPLPDEANVIKEETSIFENVIEETAENTPSSSSTSTEDSILKQIRKQ